MSFLRRLEIVSIFIECLLLPRADPMILPSSASECQIGLINNLERFENGYRGGCQTFNFGGVERGVGEGVRGCRLE